MERGKKLKYVLADNSHVLFILREMAVRGVFEYECCTGKTLKHASRCL